MNVRKIDLEQDAEIIFKWFENRKWPHPAVADVAPEFGLIAEQGGVGIACVWIYLTGRSLAYMDWLATNPDLPNTMGTLGIDAIVEYLKDFCKVSEPRIRALSLVTKNKSLAAHMQTSKFRKEEGYYKLTWTSK